MKNLIFHSRLRGLELGGQRLTVTALAGAIRSTPSHLSQVLNNRPGVPGQKYGTGRGGRTRRVIARFLRENYPGAAGEILKSLGWDEEGRRLAGTLAPPPPSKIEGRLAGTLAPPSSKIEGRLAGTLAPPSPSKIAGTLAPITEDRGTLAPPSPSKTDDVESCSTGNKL